MNSATDLPVTVKCRLGLGSDESTEFLNKFVERIAEGRLQTHLRPREDRHFGGTFGRPESVYSSPTT